MSNPEEQDAVDLQAYTASTFDAESMLKEYGFEPANGLEYGWFKRTQGNKLYRIVPALNGVTSRCELWSINSRGERDRCLQAGQFPDVNFLRNWLKVASGRWQHESRTESIEDEDNPQAYISGALDTESVLKRNGFTYEGTSTLNKQHWLKWLTKRKVISVIVDVNLDDEERLRKASLGASGIGPIDYRVLKTCKDKDTEGDFQVLHRAYGINVLRLQSELAELNRRTESAEDDDVDPAAFIASTLDHATALAELGFLQHSLPGHKELWVSKIGNRNIQVEPMDDGRLMCRIYRWNVNSWKHPTALDLIAGMACDNVPELRKYIAARSIPATPLTAESSELVHRLLDAIPDALEPLGEIDQIVEPRCPACESTDVTAKDADSLRDCMSCGIWFKPDALNEDDLDGIHDAKEYAIDSVDTEGYHTKLWAELDAMASRRSRSQKGNEQFIVKNCRVSPSSHPEWAFASLRAGHGLRSAADFAETKYWGSARNLFKLTDVVGYLKMLAENLEDDPADYISQLPSRVDHLATLVKAKTCTKEEAVEYAIIQAELVLHIFEKDFPDDKRPRQAIEAARKWWREPNADNEWAAHNAADVACDSACAADAARRAATNPSKAAMFHAAADAADAAAQAAWAASTHTGNADYIQAYAEHALNFANAARNHAGVTESLEDEISDLKAYALLHGNGPQNPRIVTTFNTITPESAEQGGYADSGWEDETGFDCTPDEFDEEEGKTVADVAAKFLWDKGATASSSSHFSPGGWYSSERSTTDWRTGEETEYTFHLVCFTPEQEQEVWNKLLELRRPRPRN